MTHFERIHAAMRREKPDRVPVMCQLSLEFMARNNNKPIDWHNAESVADAFLYMRELFDFDGVLVTGMIADSDKPPENHIMRMNHRGMEISEIEADTVLTKSDYSYDMALHKLIAAKGRAGHFSVHGEIASPFDAFVFNAENVNVEVALRDQVFENYKDLFATGLIDADADTVVDRFIAEQAHNAAIIVAEAQRQLDEFLGK